VTRYFNFLTGTTSRIESSCETGISVRSRIFLGNSKIKRSKSIDLHNLNESQRHFFGCVIDGTVV
jgi:hypothetical protein